MYNSLLFTEAKYFVKFKQQQRIQISSDLKYLRDFCPYANYAKEVSSLDLV